MTLSVVVIETPELGDRSHVAHDGEVAVVIDPQRDLDRIEAVLDELGVRVALVAETHVHNDYVTGGFELARRTGAPYLVAAAERVAFERDAVADGDERRAGTLTVRVVATPGHTDTHLAYVVSSPDDAVVFTGGSLLYGSVGRTDLVDPARTDELTRAQYRSAHRLADLLADDTAVHPTHGFGSFCSAGAVSGAGDTSTIGLERQRNDALTTSDEDAFVERLVAGLTAYPAYYAHMAPLNRQGPGPVDLSPLGPVDADALRDRIKRGEWVVDLRDRVAYAAEHVRGTVGIPLGTQFATYLGWLIPWGTPLTLVGTSADEVAAAQRQLARIGIDRPAGAAVGTPGELAAPDELGSHPVRTFADLAAARDRGDDLVVLDVRRPEERARGHVPGSAHVPLAELLDRLTDLPESTLWVHCAAGYRAAVGAGLLARAGRDVVVVDDDYATAVAIGLATG